MLFINLLLIIVSLLLPAALLANSSNISQKNVELDELNQKIQALQENLQSDRSQQLRLNKELEHAETNIGQMSQTLIKTRQQLTEQRQQIDALNQQTNAQQASLNGHQQLLAKQLITTYKMGDHNYLKLLLNQQNPDQVSRMMTYYQYLNKARGEFINDMSDNLRELVENKRKILSHSEHLQELIEDEETTMRQLEVSQQYRQSIIQRLNVTIQSNDEQLQQLNKDKAALEVVIEQLNRETKQRHSLFKSMPKPEVPSLPFSQLRGKLPWPTEGAIDHLFGKKNNDGITANGVLIKAPEGQAVQAIYPGQVVFANWMRGFGLLLIIDHQDDFMTLYAHNYSLYKKQGESVSAGDLIATVGNTGGNSNHGLYFEIRRNGKPVNPSTWCSRQT